MRRSAVEAEVSSTQCLPERSALPDMSTTTRGGRARGNSPFFSLQSSMLDVSPKPPYPERDQLLAYPCRPPCTPGVPSPCVRDSIPINMGRMAEKSSRKQQAGLFAAPSRSMLINVVALLWGLNAATRRDDRTNTVVEY